MTGDMAVMSLATKLQKLIDVVAKSIGKSDACPTKIPLKAPDVPIFARKTKSGKTNESYLSSPIVKMRTPPITAIAFAPKSNRLIPNR